MDHRSVHCTLKIMVRKGVQPRRRSNFKNWRSVLDQHGNPAVYQHCIRRLLTLNRVSSAASLEKIWTTAASRHGCSSRHRLCFVPSEPLQCLRSRWGREKKDTGSTLAERIKFANPHSSIASMGLVSGDSWKMEGNTTFLAPKCSALMLFALMKMIFLSCWQKIFSKAHVKCQFQRNIFSATFGPLMH